MDSVEKTRVINTLALADRAEATNVRIINKSLSITWETNFSLISFTKPYIYAESYIFTGTGRIENQNVSRFLDRINGELFQDLERVMAVVDAIDTGSKIVPAVFHRYIANVNGVRTIATTTDAPDGLHLMEGDHRLRLAKALGLVTVPTVIFEKNHYRFDIPKFNIVVGTTNMTFTLIASPYTQYVFTIANMLYPSVGHDFVAFQY